MNKPTPALCDNEAKLDSNLSYASPTKNKSRIKVLFDYCCYQCQRPL